MHLTCHGSASLCDPNVTHCMRGICSVIVALPKRGTKLIKVSAAAYSSIFAIAAPAQTTTSTQPVVLWQNLTVGMSPAQAMLVIQQVPGVRDVRIDKPGRPDGRRLRIRYSAEKMQLAGLPFEMAPQFGKDGLERVAVATLSQCGARALETYIQLSSALASKYTLAPQAPATITAADFARAEYASRQSNKPQGLATAYTNKDTAVMLTFEVSVEARPAVPTYSDRVSMAIWSLLRQQYEQRRAECDGTGDRRMNIVLTYLPRSQYDAALAKGAADAETSEKMLKDQL